MNVDVDSEAPRPRPLSAGLWTIFSWLRRSDRSSSSESISSVGSDRTAASFDFLSPIYYPQSQAPVIRPLNSPTDSYKRRVQERNLRRQRERGVTLHRKYGLWREDGGYDGFSLPTHKNIAQPESNNPARCRRAASECLHRRAAYVPGKRRAPQPPTLVTTSLPRNYKRKRPAPKPPLKAIAENKENIDFTNNNILEKSNSSPHIEPEIPKHTIPENNQSKEVKLRSEKSFLKQLFEIKKRHSAIDVSHVKLLPNISELDRQAAEIIENNKRLSFYNPNSSLKANKGINEELDTKNSTNTMWVCITCLRRYNLTVRSCVYCVPTTAPSSSTQTEIKDNRQSSSSQCVSDDEKKKLREILKEMKHSLPKKSNDIKIQNGLKLGKRFIPNETPTLRIGSTIKEDKIDNDHIAVDSCHKTKTKNLSILRSTSQQPAQHYTRSRPKSETSDSSLVRAIITSSDLKNISVRKLEEKKDNITVNKNCIDQKLIHLNEDINVKETPKKSKENELQPQSQHISKNKVKVSNNASAQTPLSISSLLNPIYQSKNLANIEPSTKENITTKIQFEKTLLVGNTADDVKSESKTDLLHTNQSVPKEVNINKGAPMDPPQNKLMLDKKIVSQIIKKSIEEKDKRIEGAQANTNPSTSKGENVDHLIRRELINQLEASISKGDEKAAAEAAAKLAKLKLSCSVLSFSSQIIAGPSTSGLDLKNKEVISVKCDNQMPQTKNQLASAVTDSKTIETKQVKGDKIIRLLPDKRNDEISVEVWIEDKIAARGPVRLNISRRSTVADLKREAATFLGIAVRLQRWIIGKTLCNDDDLVIATVVGPKFDAPFYLCLVETGESKTNNVAKSEAVQDKAGEFYNELMKLEQQALVVNTENFECGVCIEDCGVGKGAVLRECLHTFCKECLSDSVRHCEEPVVSCPAIGCPGVLQDREIRALLSEEDYEKWLARGLAAAESGTRNTFHCRTADCSGWAFCEPGVRIFPCPVCKKRNCVPCQAVHGGTCEEYQKKLREAVTAAETSNSDGSTQALLTSLIARGEALECPECKAIITKKWGCDWVKCSACKTEICWITKGRRWGPNGRGDTSAGCRCGVDGKRCHPLCAYCH